MSASEAARRCALSKNTSVAGTARSSSRARRRACSFAGRNPANRKRSHGSPDRTSAASGADAPGTTVTAMPRASASRTSLNPGSETSGVPASEMRATRAPASSRAMSLGRMRFGIVLVIGRALGRDVVMREELKAHARVLAGDEVGRAQDAERAQRDILDIADRRRDEIEAGRERRSLVGFTSRRGVDTLSAFRVEGHRACRSRV